MSSPLVSREEAYRKPTHHQMIVGMGYLAHSGPPALPLGANGNKNCAPPADAKDGSRHLLLPPNGAPAMPFVWIAAHRAWGSALPQKGNRLAWPIDHLMRAGWAYVKPE